MTPRRRFGACFAVALLITACASPSETPDAPATWPGFLGPAGNVVGDHPDLPTTWSSTENVEWRTEIPGRGWSSPIVWGDRVFVTAEISEQPVKEPGFGVDFGNQYIEELLAEGKTMSEAEEIADARDTEFRGQISITLVLYCLDLTSGEVLWQRQLFEGTPAIGRHRKNSFASETPVTDGEAVYVYASHHGLYAVDFDGAPLWTTALKAYPILLEFGGGTSPALHGDDIYVLNDNEEASFLAAFDKRTGEARWRTPRSGLGTQRHSGWSSPFVWRNELRTELVTLAPLTAIGYDMSGRELWRMGRMGRMPIPTPIAYGGLLYLVSGPPGTDSWPIAAVRAGASGDITVAEGDAEGEHVAWYDWRGGVYLSTPVIYADQLYVLTDKGVVSRYDARTGELGYRERLAATTFTASPWAYNGRVFFLSEEGDTYVIGSGGEYQLLAVNALEEYALASPAIVGDRLLLRTQHHIWSLRDAALPE